MSEENQAARLDQHLRLRLAELKAKDFEQFFLHFLNAGISLVVERGGRRIERKVIEANIYAAGSGRADKGIDLVARMEGGETWAFQCKGRKSWDISLSKKAVEAATFPAQHYFLLVACDPHKDVQDFMDQYPNWSFWNLDRICQEFRLRVPKHKQSAILHFLTPEELKRFAPYATDALVPATEYFGGIQRAGHSFHHNYPLVGRRTEMAVFRKFVADPKAKVLKISAKGGEGKSRLLWEFANTIPQDGLPEVLFLNPHSTGELALALWEQETPRVIVVDDAHLRERVSPELLALVRAGNATKLVLATRPQGNEAVDERLREQGFADIQTLELPSLKKKDMEALAEEALGSQHKHHAKDLIARTGDSPFLTALAGDLIRRGQLRWGTWHSDGDFRASVFRSFEADNLAHLGESDRKQGARILRIVALLAPVNPDAVFHERAAACLEIPKVDVEALLNRLQAAGVVSAEDGNVRVIPDLFADFLVFDTVFDPKRSVPLFARTVLEQFKGEAPILLRNLAEASWVASTQKIKRDELMRPLLDAEFTRFDELDFFERARLIEHWATFSVYLPAESLELAEKALAQKTAPPNETYGFDWDVGDDGIHSHRYLLSRLPTMLKPVALWHDDYRDSALDLLWKLGIDAPRGMFQGGQNHPWSVIAEVIKFTPRKSVHVTAAAVDWIARLVRWSSVRKLIESNQSVLATLLKPCFARFVEFSEWHGRSLSWWERPVNMETTAPVRARAREILAEVIEQDSWRLALDAVRAVEQAMRRIASSEAARMKNPDAFRELWRPDREMALGLLSNALVRHSHPMLRFAVRQVLQRDVAYEEDEVFRGKVREVLEAVTDDLDLRLLTILNSQGYFEFAGEFGAPIGKVREKIEERWQQRIGSVADELLAARPDAADAVDYLDRLADASFSAGYTPNFSELLSVLARHHPDRAIALVEVLLDPARKPRIAGVWHQLLFGLADHRDKVWPLIQKAASHPNTSIRRGVVDYFRYRERKAMTLTGEERQLLERMAAQAGADEVMSFVELVQWVSETSAEWGFQLLGTLRLADLPPAMNGEVLAALNPYHAKSATPPESTVRHVLNALVPISEISVDHFGGGFERAKELYPRVVYDFVLQRIARYEFMGPKVRFQVLPHEVLSRFRLPGLERAPDFPAICDFLWQKVSQPPQDHTQYVWRELFQAVALDRVEFWLPKLIEEVKNAPSLDVLREKLELIHFDGSLVIFRFPELTSSVLQRARDLEGTKGYENIRFSLYAVTGPSTRGYTNGKLDEERDYVEAEAINAATSHATDPDLGPFFRWIVDVEKHEREDNRRRYAADMAAMDE